MHCLLGRRGVLMCEFLPRGETVNADRYCQTLRNLRRSIQNRRRGMLTRSITLLYDNSRLHKAQAIRNLLLQLEWEIFDHPTYIPDHATNVFNLFRLMKSFLAGKCFHNDGEVQVAVTSWLQAYKRWCTGTINASVTVATMMRSSQ